MKTFKDFNLQIDKQHVLDKMQAKPKSDVYEIIVGEYDEVYLEIQSLMYPTFYVKRMKRMEHLTGDILQSYDEIVLCVVTIGDELGKYVRSLFEKGDYLRAMLTENIADDLLFELSCQSYCILKSEAKKEQIGLSERFSPGEQLDMELQKAIVEELGLGEHGITVNDSCVITPFKSMAYLYGVRKDQVLPEVDFDCSMCSNKSCDFKKSLNDRIICNITESGQENQSYEVKTGQKLLEILREKAANINAACSGKGTCGKCKVRIEPAMPLTEADRQLLTEDEIMSGIRLACQCTVDRDIRVILDGTSEVAILDQHVGSKYEITPMTEYLKLEAIQEKIKEEVCLEDTFSFEIPFTLSALRQLNLMIEIHKKDCAYAVVSNNLITGLYETDVSLYGLAIDIGTTTIVAKKIDFGTGKDLQTKAFLNPQRRYGADVISRIEYASRGETQLKTLSKVLQKAIHDAVLDLRDLDHGLQAVVVSGNTTMIQLLLEWPSKALGQLPYRHVTRQTIKTTYKEIFRVSDFECDVVILPALSSYVGGDIASGLLHLGFNQSEEINMLIDLGTNGEIAIGNQERILTTATAAGPAFEGARLKCGTGSVAGAICSFNMQPDKTMEFETIGDKQANGLCGTGAMDVLAELLRLGYVDETGFLSENEFPLGEFQVTEDIVLTQKDIRELQLAKSAIQSGLETLIEQYGCSYDTIKTVYIAGGFGMNLKKETLAQLGILPDALKDCMVIAGNTSLGGAIDYMLNADFRKGIDDLKKINQTVQLAEAPGFNEKFMENMMF